MNDEDITKKPEKKAGDVAHTLMRGVLSSAPYAGGIAAELFSLVIVPPLERRRDEWIESIARKLNELENKMENFKIDDLKDNEAFVTVVLHATTVALRTHQGEKLDALKNAVLNAALPGDPDEDIQMVLLRYIDEFTPYHIKILNVLRDPREWAEKYNPKLLKFDSPATVEMFITTALPELRGRTEFYKQIFDDLYIRGLIDFDGNKIFSHSVTNGPLASHTTRFGNDFLDFTSLPDQL